MPIISPLGIESITLQHDRADEIVFGVYYKVNLITQEYCVEPTMRVSCCVCDVNVYSLVWLCFLFR